MSRARRVCHLTHIIPQMASARRPLPLSPPLGRGFDEDYGSCAKTCRRRIGMPICSDYGNTSGDHLPARRGSFKHNGGKRSSVLFFGQFILDELPLFPRRDCLKMNHWEPRGHCFAGLLITWPIRKHA